MPLDLNAPRPYIHKAQYTQTLSFVGCQRLPVASSRVPGRKTQTKPSFWVADEREPKDQQTRRSQRAWGKADRLSKTVTSFLLHLSLTLCHRRCLLLARHSYQEIGLAPSLFGIYFAFIAGNPLSGKWSSSHFRIERHDRLS
ncbi:hypothetical protein Ddc_17345 [Ditylenchus destructor]|nr:hypothetical protein Ddc_17345 [Ditylenchus destructor]